MQSLLLKRLIIYAEKHNLKCVEWNKDALYNYTICLEGDSFHITYCYSFKTTAVEYRFTAISTNKKNISKITINDFLLLDSISKELKQILIFNLDELTANG